MTQRFAKKTENRRANNRKQLFDLFDFVNRNYSFLTPSMACLGKIYTFALIENFKQTVRNILSLKKTKQMTYTYFSAVYRPRDAWQYFHFFSPPELEELQIPLLV